MPPNHSAHTIEDAWSILSSQRVNLAKLETRVDALARELDQLRAVHLSDLAAVATTLTELRSQGVRNAWILATMIGTSNGALGFFLTHQAFK